MARQETGYKYIVLDDAEVATIEPTTMKVIELVAEHVAWGWSPWELQYQHPYLTLGQVFSALAYYADHRAEIDRQLADESAEVARLREQQEHSPLVERLRELKRRQSA